MASTEVSSLSLVGGVLAFDFANTGSRDGAPAAVEHLQTPSDLVDWSLHAGGIDKGTADRQREAVAADAEGGLRLLRRARELRGAIQATGSAIANRRLPADADLGTVKAFAGRAVGHAALAPRQRGGYGFDFSEAEPESALLGPVAWSLVELLGGDRLDRVKECPECRWLFFDGSKNNSRVWCDMATCGNRTKLRRHRKRR